MHHLHNRPQNKIKNLFIRKDQILAEVETQIQIVSEMRVSDKGMQTPQIGNATERFLVQFERWIDKYLDLAKSRMAAYVLEEERKSAMNAHYQWDEVTIKLSFPPTWNETTFTQLGEAVQGYIVNSCLYEYFILTLSSRDPLTQDKMMLAEECNSQIKHCCVSSLPGTQRKKLHPF